MCVYTYIYILTYITTYELTCTILQNMEIRTHVHVTYNNAYVCMYVRDMLRVRGKMWYIRYTCTHRHPMYHERFSMCSLFYPIIFPGVGSTSSYECTTIQPITEYFGWFEFFTIICLIFSHLDYFFRLISKSANPKRTQKNESWVLPDQLPKGWTQASPEVGVITLLCVCSLDLNIYQSHLPFPGFYPCYYLLFPYY